MRRRSAQSAVATLIARGIEAQQAGDAEQARRCYVKVLATAPDNIDALQLLGTLAYAAGDYQACVDWIGRALRIARHPVLLANQGMALEALGQLDAAAACHREAATLRPDDAGHALRLGQVLLRAGHHAEAIAAAEAALRLDPAQPQALAVLCNALRLGGRLDAALDVAQRACAAHPDSADAEVDRGSVLHAAGELDAARQAFERAIALDPESRVAWHDLACCLDVRGDAGAALAAFRRCIELDPDDADAAAELGMALLRHGRSDEAEASLARALALEPGNEVARHFLAAVREERPPRASAAYVRELFDNYAPGFEQHLRQKLDYRTPELIAAALPPGQDLDILDLGAGTGLMGELLQAQARSLVGVDLSPRMLAIAAQRQIYHRLETADLASYLAAAASASVDRVVAADVFVYLGELDEVFAGVRRLLRPGGSFAFSLERADDDSQPYRLGRSGRYVHSRACLDTLCHRHGFALLQLQAAALRSENDKPVQGWIVVLG